MTLNNVTWGQRPKASSLLSVLLDMEAAPAKKQWKRLREITLLRATRCRMQESEQNCSQIFFKHEVNLGVWDTTMGNILHEKQIIIPFLYIFYGQHMIRMLIKGCLLVTVETWIITCFVVSPALNSAELKPGKVRWGICCLADLRVLGLTHRMLIYFSIL